ncbi:MAG TPA: hypothetical protein DGP89_01390 [Saprospirales bacterium]|nr:hypothetical protein [Saprospirales bacterium]
MINNHYALQGLFLIAITLISGWTTQISAQNSNVPKEVTATYLLTNAHIISHPGQTTFGSVLLRDGLIEQVGANIIAPYDAQIIDMDSMYIYAGFIDALSQVGLKKKEKEERPNVKDPGNPPNTVAGITPEHSVYDDYSSKESSVKKLRDQGYGIAHIVPQGRMLPGMGAIFSLGEGESAQLVIKKEASMFSQLKSANRVAPGTTIGVMAKYRDIYRNAAVTSEYSSKYNMNPVGMRRAQSEPAIEAFIPVVNKQLPVYFIAKNALDVSRVIALQKELGFNLVLADVEQGWPMASKITAGRYPLVLSMNLPKAIKEEKKEEKDESKMTEEEKEKAVNTKAKKEKKKKKEEAKLSLLEKANKKEEMAREERKKESIKDYEGQAAMMEKKGIKFAFTGISTKPGDIRKNLKRMMDAGLSESAALAALTTNAADQLGISKIAGTIEKGKLANLVITDKPYFEEKSAIRYVFVDGQMNEMKKKDEKKGDIEKGAGAALAGEWKYSIEIPGQTQSGVIKITADVDELTIEVSSADSPEDFEEATAVSLNGSNLTFDLSIDYDGFQMELSYDLEIAENAMKGMVKAGQFGSFPLEGSRDPR